MKFTTKALLAATIFAGFLWAGCAKEEQPLDMSVMPLAADYTEPQHAPSAEAAEVVPEMLWIGPGANISEIRFKWYSNGTSSKPAIRFYGENDALVSVEDSCWSHSLAAPLGGSAPQKLSNKCVVRKLVKNTTYQYSVSSNDGADWSPKYEYKTSAGSNNFKFAAVSDPQIEGDKVSTEDGWKSVMSKIVSHGVEFVTCSGDQINNYFGSESEYQMFFSPPQLRNLAVAVTMGNHESNNMFHNHFNLPNATTPCVTASYDGRGCRMPSDYYFDPVAANYWFLYNNILFVAPNTGATMSLAQAETEVARYDSLFAAAKAASAGKYDWLICVHHRSTRSVGPHAAQSASGSEKDTTLPHLKNAGFEKIMDKHQVDLVLAGHEHYYTRTHPLKDNAVVPHGQGTIYLTLLPAGSSKYYFPDIDKTDWEALLYPARNAQWWTDAFKKPGYAIFEVNGGTLSATVYDVADKVADQFTLTKSATSVLESERRIPSQGSTD